MVDEAAPHDRHGLEATMWMRREAGHALPVVHTPAVTLVEVLAQVATCQRRGGAEAGVGRWIRVVVVRAEQERIQDPPLEAQLFRLEDDLRVRPGGVQLVFPLRRRFAPAGRGDGGTDQGSEQSAAVHTKPVM